MSIAPQSNRHAEHLSVGGTSSKGRSLVSELLLPPRNSVAGLGLTGSVPLSSSAVVGLPPGGTASLPNDLAHLPFPPAAQPMRLASGNGARHGGDVLLTLGEHRGAAGGDQVSDAGAAAHWPLKSLEEEEEDPARGSIDNEKLLQAFRRIARGSMFRDGSIAR